MDYRVLSVTAAMLNPRTKMDLDIVSLVKRISDRSQTTWNNQSNALYCP